MIKPLKCLVKVLFLDFFSFVDRTVTVLKYNGEYLNQCKVDFDGKFHFQMAKLFCFIW